MIKLPPNLLCFQILYLLCVGVVSSGAQHKILCIGDSITTGFPNNDSESYHTYLTPLLSGTTTYLGNPDDRLSGGNDRGADGMPIGDYIVGGNGNVISKVPSGTVFPRRGAEESFDTIKATVDIPYDVVVLIGVNDIIELIAPKDRPVPSDDQNKSLFVPGAVLGDFSPSGGTLPSGNGDYTSAGVFIDEDVDYDAMTDSYTYNGSPSLIAVDALIERYEDLLDKVAAAFPPSTHITMVTIPIPDAAGAFGDSQFQDAREELKAQVRTFNSQIASLAASRGSRYTCVNPRLIEPINVTDPGSPSYVPSPDIQSGDGLHPSPAGYEKIGRAVANVILYRGWAEGEFGSDFDVPSKEGTIWGREADPDNDGWRNIYEYYLSLDPLAFDEPLMTSTVSGDTFTLGFQRRDTAIEESVYLQYSVDLINWDTVGLTSTSGSAAGGLVPVTSTLTQSGWERVFFGFKELSLP